MIYTNHFDIETNDKNYILTVKDNILDTNIIIFILPYDSGQIEFTLIKPDEIEDIIIKNNKNLSEEFIFNKDKDVINLNCIKDKSITLIIKNIKKNFLLIFVN